MSSTSTRKTPARGKRASPAGDADAVTAAALDAVPLDSSTFQPETPAEDDTFDIDPTLSGAGNVDVDVHEETNRLTAFVQHVLADNDPHRPDERPEAEHLLSFSEEGLFAPTHRAEDLLHTESDAGAGAGDASIQEALTRGGITGVGVEVGDEVLDPDLIAREAEAAQQQQAAEEGGPRWGKKRRVSRDEDDNTPKTKKESHADVERRRRDMINDGITALSALLPGSSARSKGALLRQAVEHLSELTARVQKFDEEISKKEEEKATLQHELAQVRTGLEEEQKRSLKYERFWREAEDRAATGEFDSQRLRAELEALKKSRQT